jgi:hypothetical protein
MAIIRIWWNISYLGGQFHYQWKKAMKETVIKNNMNFWFWLASTYALSMVKMAMPAMKNRDAKFKVWDYDYLLREHCQNGTIQKYSEVGIGQLVQSMGWTAVVQLLAIARDFSLFYSVQPPILWVLGSFPKVKQSGHDTEHSPPPSQKWWSYTSTPPYAFMALCLIKHRDYVTFYTSSQ